MGWLAGGVFFDSHVQSEEASSVAPPSTHRGCCLDCGYVLHLHLKEPQAVKHSILLIFARLCPLSVGTSSYIKLTPNVARAVYTREVLDIYHNLIA